MGVRVRSYTSRVDTVVMDIVEVHRCLAHGVFQQYADVGSIYQ